MNSMIGYFDLFSHYRTTIAAMQASDGKRPPSLGWQLMLYVALFSGILAKGGLEWMSGRTSTYELSWPKLAIALVTAILAYPSAYKKAMDANGPGLVQLCETFIIGYGWKALFDTAR